MSKYAGVGSEARNAARWVESAPGEPVPSLLDRVERNLVDRIAREPDRAPLQNRLGALLALEGRWSEAADRFRSALRADGSFAPAAINLDHLRVERFGEAPGRSVVEAGGFGSNLPVRYRIYHAAWDRLRRGYADEAISILLRRLSGSRRDLWTEAALVHFLHAARGGNAEPQRIAGLARLHPSLRSLLDRDEEQGPYGRVWALRSWREGPFWNPLLAAGHRAVARFASAERLWMSAQEGWESAFLLDPCLDRFHLELAIVAGASGDEEEILRHLGRALEERPDSWRLRFALGLEYARHGFIEVASRYLEDAWRRCGRLGEWVERALPRRLFPTRAADACAHFRRSLRRFPGDRQFQDGYARLLLALGRSSDLLRELDRIESDRPPDPDLRRLRGEALLRLGRTADATCCLLNVPGEAEPERDLLATEPVEQPGAVEAGFRPWREHDQLC